MKLKVRNGVLGGLAGGVVFGMLMAVMGMLPMIASLIGSGSALVGLVVHLVISAGLGLLFGWVLGARVDSLTAGLGLGALYGLVWWVLGPLVIMPLMLGMGTQFGVAFSSGNRMSLMGHLIFGVILGAVYAGLSRRSGSPAALAGQRGGS